MAESRVTPHTPAASTSSRILLPCSSSSPRPRAELAVKGRARGGRGVLPDPQRPALPRPVAPVREPRTWPPPPAPRRRTQVFRLVARHPRPATPRKLPLRPPPGLPHRPPPRPSPTSGFPAAPGPGEANTAPRGAAACRLTSKQPECGRPGPPSSSLARRNDRQFDQLEGGPWPAAPRVVRSPEPQYIVVRLRYHPTC